MVFGKDKIKMARLEAENVDLKDESEYNEHKAWSKNKALLQIHYLIKETKSMPKFGEASYRQIIRQIEEIVDRNVEKKLSDRILEHYKSNNS